MQNNFSNQIFIITVIGILSLCIESSLLHFMIPASFVPHVQFLLVIFLAFHFGDQGSLFAGFILGLIADLFSSGPLGPMAGAHVVLFSIVSALSSRLFLDSWFSTGVVCFIGCVIGNTTALFFGTKFSFSSVIGELPLIFTTSFFSAIIASSFFLVLRKLLSVEPYARKS